MFTHEDDRRLLVEMQPGAYKACKVVLAKGDCVLGNHYHQHKDERFLLVQGEAKRVQIGDDVWCGISAPYEWSVPRGVVHTFELASGSIMVGTETEEFDPHDEIQGQ